MGISVENSYNGEIFQGGNASNEKLRKREMFLKCF